MSDLAYDDAHIRDVLGRVKTIAAVGISANDMRPSYFAMLENRRSSTIGFLCAISSTHIHVQGEGL
jgi:hypothetical protein